MDLKREFQVEDIKWLRNIVKCLSSLSTREMKIKITLSFHLMGNPDGNVEKDKPLFTVGGIASWFSTQEISVGHSQKN